MSFGSMVLMPTTATIGVAAMSLLGVAIWWLRRKRQRRIWLPTMRIMRIEPRILPRLVMRVPPLIAFICFIISVLALVLHSLRPSSEVFAPFEPNQTRIHIFCDLSPSVAAQVTLDEYAAQVTAIFESMQNLGRVSLSTSYAATIHQPENADAVGRLIRSVGFQRAGVRLGAAIKQLVNGGLEANRLIVVSDRDQHSWTDFNWRYLSDEMEVIFYDLQRTKESVANYFINDARFLSSPAAVTQDWDVEIIRRSVDEAAQGRLTATFMGQELTAVPWQFAPGKQRLNVRLSWPAASLVEVDRSSSRDVPLVFRLEPEGQDAIAADNAFRSEIRGLKQDALVISESGGERSLEDLAEELSVSLSIQGFRVRRYDYIGEGVADLVEFPLVVAIGGHGSDNFCPVSLAPTNLSKKSRRSGTDTKKSSPRILPKVWLAPSRLDADFRMLCSCFVKLQMPSEGAPIAPELCQQVKNREDWIQLLPLLGGKQIGGSVGENARALAYLRRDPSSGLEVLAFTVPLMPMVATGITHASMPIMIKELLKWQGVGEAYGPVGANWPRVDDFAQVAWQGEGTRDSELMARIRLSNVPIGESLMTQLEQSQLPPRWSNDPTEITRQLPTKKDREDPLPWLRIVAVICVMAMFLEGALDLVSRLVRLVKNRPQLLILALALIALSESASAKVEISLLSSQGVRPSFAVLAREVSQRTSIEIDSKPTVHTQVSPEALAEPWLWVERLDTISTKSGALDHDLALWLKRGGLLIVEAPWTVTQLDTLVTRLNTRQAGSNDGWKPLPPDHELMRSFYLLDALPSCQGEIWRGYQFDGRLAILAIPYGFLQSVRDQSAPVTCSNPPDNERATRIFVNMIMVALATDYKRDQIHLPEILKRLR
ncbi:MAG: DUF4159 domain-containing protein [Deltaproteobacteria bacterium]|nr:DUF4159 domain-containing protein [Deltaproteobacteria bacterium]